MKLIPGNNRRGKGDRLILWFVDKVDYCCLFVCLFTAAKAAVLRFTQSRDAMQREKDLLKSVKV